MHNEQIFTPQHVTKTMFNELEYKGSNIRKKHVIDNSCGNGAILKEVVTTYINVCILSNLSKEEIKEELETYIHGIEIDKNLVCETLHNLSVAASQYSIFGVDWDIRCADAMNVKCFDGMMDYVFGNPPYCNIHHIKESKREQVKSYKFANGGMTDMYLVFFEIGINMLNENGKLAYITPNSWLTSTAGANFRNYLKESHTLLEIYQYGHEKVFENVNTYTCITCLSKNPKSNNIFICQRNIEHFEGFHDLSKFKCTTENLDECMIGGKIYLCDDDMLSVLREINDAYKHNKYKLKVKNGFATLNDKFFILDDCLEYWLDDNVLSVIKASDGEKHHFFYPYDKDGKPMKLSDMNDKLVHLMIERAKEMGVNTEEPDWYLYGRTQALNDVKHPKIILNNLIRHTDDLKISVVPEQNGVYSGFYIPLYVNIEEITDKIIKAFKSPYFMKYVKAVGKYKNQGYYTFSSKEAEMWINYVLNRK